MSTTQQQEKNKEQLKKKIQVETPVKEKPIEQKTTPKVVKNPLMRSNPDPLSRKPKQQPSVKSQVRPPKAETVKQKEIKEEKKQEGKVCLPQKIPEQKVEDQKEQKKKTEEKQTEQKPKQSEEKLTREIKQINSQPAKQLQPKEKEKAEQITKDLKDLVSEIRQPEVKNKITAKIVDSVVKGTTLSKYTLYHLQGSDNHGNFRIQRKLAQFNALRKCLRQRWPGVFIPGLSLKSQLKQNSQKQKQMRLILENFVIGLSYSEFLYYREEVQLFLRSQQIDIEEFTMQMPVLKAPDIIERYKSCFEEDLFETKNETKPIIKKFIASLQKNIPHLKELATKTLAVSQTYNHYSQGLGKFSEITRTYQQHCLSFFTNNKRQKTIITKDETNSIDVLKEVSKVNPFFLLYQFVFQQLKDAEAFLEIILSCDQFSSKCRQLKQNILELDQQIQEISKGHKTMKTVTSRKTNEQILEQLETKVKKIRKDEYIINQVFMMSYSLLVKVTISSFKTFERDAFKLMIIEWNRITSDLHPQIEALWKSVEAQTQALLK